MSASEQTPPAIVHSDDRAERKWPHLIVLHGAGVGEVHRVIGREAVVGRDLGCDVRIEHPTVSRRHARLIVAGERVLIEDLGSTNGTLVGLNTVRGRRMVPDGAVVALGSVTLLKLTYSAILDDVLRRADYQRATTDPATRVASLEYLRDQLRAECAYARRHHAPLTIVSFRADELDPSADRSATDAVMGALAVTVHEATRDEDVLARSARAEFIVLLRADADQARVMAERVRSRVADARRVGGLGSAISTVTCAVVQIGKTALASPENVIDWATTNVRAVTADVRDRVVRLAPLESPAMRRKDPE